MAWSHGTDYGYRRKLCGCDACCAAHARQLEASRKRRHTRYRLTCPDCGGKMSGGNGSANDPQRCLNCHHAAVAYRHGTNSGYTQDCRCDACRAAHAAYKRMWYARRKVAV